MEPSDASPEFLTYNELISASNGGQILFATDDFFAVAENLLKDEEPKWLADVYTEFGKWMDGWETRRRRQEGHDWAIIKLRERCIIKGICVDTSHFTGNYAPRFSLSASCHQFQDFKPQNRDSRLGTEATEEEIQQIDRLRSQDWATLVPMRKLRPGNPETRLNYFEVNSTETWDHLRLNLYPDGGVARLRVYGLIRSTIGRGLSSGAMLDLASTESGAGCLDYSNAHYGHPRNLIRPEPGKGMMDGWETARRMDRPPIIRVAPDKTVQAAGEEWAIFRLAAEGWIRRVTVDTKHFKGNHPDTIVIEAALVHEGNYLHANWVSILPKKKLQPDRQQDFEIIRPASDRLVDHVKVTIAPDGGFSRLRIWGETSKSE